ncbi:MAG: outer membrane beta-barrel domain-containing protein [Myxococcaceae bacterium]
MSARILLLTLLVLAPGAWAQAPAPAPAQAPAPAAAPDASPSFEAGDTAAMDRDIGPLKDRVPPVTGYTFRMAHRFEFAPNVGFSFRDAFWTKLLVGFTATYHFTETIGLALRADYAITSVSNSAQVCPPGQACFTPSSAQLDGKAPGHMNWLTGLDLEWAPLYGKISLFAEGFAHFNMYLIGGPIAVQYQAPKSLSGGSEAAWTGGFEVGLGMRFVFNRWMALRFELRDEIYREKTQAATETTGALYQVRNQFFFGIGLSMFFPTTFPEG